MEEIAIRECERIDELDQCVRLQREVFGLPDLEISPRRHLIVSRQAGGWTLGAFRTLLPTALSALCIISWQYGARKLLATRI